MKCVNCIHCIGFTDGFYWCNLLGKEYIEFVEEWCANDEKLYCDGYDEDRNDDFTARSGKHRRSVPVTVDA